MRLQRLWLPVLLGLVTSLGAIPGYGQNTNLNVAVLVDSTNPSGYSTNPSALGEFQRFIQVYLDHLQVPYDILDVSSGPPPLNLGARQLIIVGHRRVNLPASWQSAIVNAVSGGAGFVNFDSDISIGNQAHIQTIFGASGATLGTAASQISVPAAVLAGGSAPHYITAMQQNFFGTTGDVVYNFHPDTNGVVNQVTAMTLVGSNARVLARLGTDPLILAVFYGSGRAVDFTTYDYLQADRFGYLMGVDDLFWRSLVWAARKPFALRGYPRFWSMVIHHNADGWASRIREMYDTTLTGQVALDGTGGPWRVTGSVFTNLLPPGNTDRVAMIQDIQAGRLQVHPHGFQSSDFGDAFWNGAAQRALTDAEWLANLNSILSWQQGNGGSDRIPSFSRWMVGHFFNLSNNVGFDFWNSLGFRYVGTTLRPGFQYNYIPNQYGGAERMSVRPFWLYQVPPKPQNSFTSDESYPFFFSDTLTFGSRSGQPSQNLYVLSSRNMDRSIGSRIDIEWCDSAGGGVSFAVQKFQWYSWRLISSMVPVEIYTHDEPYNTCSDSGRRQIIANVSSWLNSVRARQSFIQDSAEYSYARNRSTLTQASYNGSQVSYTFTGSTANPDGTPVSTQLLVFSGDDEGQWQTVPGFTAGLTSSLAPPPPPPPPAPVTTSLSPSSTTVGGPSFTLTVNGGNFFSNSVVRWNGAALTTTFVSGSQLTAVVPSSNIAAPGTAQITVFTPAPGGGSSNAQTFSITGGNPVPGISSLNPIGATVGRGAFTLTVNGSNFVLGSVVLWNGANRATTFVSATQLTASILSSDTSAAGTAQVTVFNPAPVGGTSNAQPFTIYAPGSGGPGNFFDDFNRPDSATIGNAWIEKNAPAYTLSAGRVVKLASTLDFADNLVYRPATETMQDGEASVEVRLNSLPPGYPQLFVRGQTSNIGTAGMFTGYLLYPDNSATQARIDRLENSTFAQSTPFPISPALNTTDTYRLRLRVTGQNPVVVLAFVERFNGTGWDIIGQTTFNDTAATRITGAGTVGFSGSTEGGRYSYKNFTRTSFDGNNPVPATTSISPSSAPAGGPGFTLTVNGTGFVSGSVVQWNGAARATTVVSATQLTATISSADIATAGTGQVTVSSPAPGGGVSNAQSFTITNGNPVPTTTNITPSSASAGGPAFTIQVTGSGFVSNSQVQWNGAPRTTTFVSTTRVTAAILASDLAAQGTAQVTVFNPAPGGGTSNAQTLNILPPGFTFFDDFNRPNSSIIGNGWTQKYSPAFFITNNEVTDIDTTPIDYHDTIVYRPVNEDQLDVEVSMEFRVLSTSNEFPQVHARAQRNTITQTDTLDDYIFFVDGFQALPGRAIIARQQPVQGQFECYMLAIPFPQALSTTGRYRLRFRVTGTSPVNLNGIVESWNGSNWQLFAQGTTTHDNTTQPVPGLFCSPGFMPPPLTTAGAVGFAKWTTANEVYGNFSWTSLALPNPSPTSTSLSPSSALAGGAAFTLTVNGTNFVNGSVVQWNGAARTTTFVSSTQLTAAIPATDLAASGTAQVTVFSPSPGGGTSNAQTFTINNSVPATTNISPAGAIAGGAAFTLTVNGTNFVNGSVVQWNGAARTTTFVSSTQLTAAIPATDIAAPGTAQITVFNPTPGGGTSNAQTFTISTTANPVPSLSNISPSSATAGGAGFTLTVNGGNFIASSVVQWNGSTRVTTFVSATQLTAAIPASDITTGGTPAVTVLNPAPGGGTSGALTFTINNPAPATTSISPTSAPAGGPAFTLTANGSGFVTGSVVRWNGANRTTTFVSSTQLTATILATDIAASGTAQVTVFNPTPSGGTSNAQTFTINSVPTTITFDNPPPPGSPGSFLNGVFRGIDFGTNQWAWEGPFGPDPANNIYFGSATGNSRTFTFSPAPRILISMRVFATTAGTLTLTDNLGQTFSQVITTGSMQLVTTNWRQASTTVTVQFTAGWALGVDQITYAAP